MTVTVFSQSQSPGNEMVSKWHSSTVDQEGSSNLIGLPTLRSNSSQFDSKRKLGGKTGEDKLDRRTL